MTTKTGKPLVPSNIETLKPYVAGKTIAEVADLYKPTKIAKLASNENRLGCSPKVKNAIDEAFKEIQDYPDPVARKLRAAIAERNGVNSENVLLASGSESIISILCKTFFLNKENAVTADATFVGFFVQIGVRGVHLKRIPMTPDYRYDVKAIANAIDEHTKMVYIANPNNPTGTYINKEEFEWFMQQVPEDVLVVMDEAYFEYTKGVEDYPQALDYEYDNIIVLRTFSKAYGLAGFRVGYAIANEELISNMMKTKLTFEPTTLGQAAALAAYNDHEFLQKSTDVVEESKQRLYRFFDEQNVNYVKSISNSVMMVLPSEEEAIDFTQSMLEKGVILRRINAFGLPNCIRITVGLSEEMDHFEQSFLEVTKK
ncbi:histidinol-phosphate transaminase [Gracilimonas sediminicola]|uniref:Histidinol-phosphate aminotransferase n=1 Tax=Gracilimonas sediminicola TaxID=2952158 RepID=A0A9X2RCH8_9BACT|nr:histidinol-phosphate transaminase [Gracilimonas sediminicola]MCP9290875.1 histidinol-phosphate transaminase [Gracilimonas sediminicola]